MTASRVGETSPPARRFCRLATILGSKLASRSRGTLICTGPDIGQHGLGPAAVARVPAITPGRIMLAIAQVISDLVIQGSLQQPLRQLLDHPAFASQLQAAGPGTVHW